jgi:hypothetical protein
MLYSGINKGETPNVWEKYFCLAAMAVFLGGSCLWAGDTPSFVDLAA